MTINGAHRSRSFAERELEKVQKKISEGEIAQRRRKELIAHLYREEGMTQVEIAERLTRASVAVGGRPIGDDAVWKIVKQMRSVR